MAINSWTFTGHLGKDAEGKAVGDKYVVNFSVATVSGFGNNEKTTWARCAIWDNHARAVEKYLIKGALVGITGEVSLREFVDNAGAKQSILEVKVEKLSLLGGKKEKDEYQEAAPQARQPVKHPGALDDLDDDIPF